MVIAIFSLASALVFGTIVFLYRVYNNMSEQTYTLQQARQGIALLTDHIRGITQGLEGSYPIAEIDPYGMTFFSDIDGTGAVRIRYFIENDTLMRGTVRATGTPPMYDLTQEVVATSTEYVRNNALNTPLFTYFDSDGAPVPHTASVTQVRFVRIDLVANINPARAPEDFVLRSSAALRNLKDNL